MTDINKAIMLLLKQIDCDKEGVNLSACASDESLNQAIAKIKALVVEARIDELKRARSVDSQFSSADIVDHLENRLEELGFRGD